MEADEKTLLEWLAERYPDSPKKRIKGWFQAGRVTLDGEPVTTFHVPMPDPGERLSLREQAQGNRAAASRSRLLHPQLRLVHMDASLIVVDKGAGLLSVPAPGSSRLSVDFLVREHLKVEIHPVHRLDRFTSGLMIFARDERSRRRLIESLRAGYIGREYTAFVYGVPEPRSGVWRDMLELDDAGHQQIADADEEDETAGRVEAVTHYRVVGTLPFEGRPVSRLELRLETGLKHQIRIQAARQGHPLVGDRIYSLESIGKKKVRASKLRRQALHAFRLTLPHPKDGREMVFTSPLPADLQKLELSQRKQEERD